MLAYFLTSFCYTAFFIWLSKSPEKNWKVVSTSQSNSIFGAVDTLFYGQCGISRDLCLIVDWTIDKKIRYWGSEMEFWWLLFITTNALAMGELMADIVQGASIHNFTTCFSNHF